MKGSFHEVRGIQSLRYPEMTWLSLEGGRLSCCIAIDGSQIPFIEEGSMRFTQKGCPPGMFLLVLQMISKLVEKNQKTCYKIFYRNMQGLGKLDQHRRNWSFQMDGTQGDILKYLMESSNHVNLVTLLQESRQEVSETALSPSHFFNGGQEPVSMNPLGYR